MPTIEIDKMLLRASKKNPDIREVQMVVKIPLAERDEMHKMARMCGFSSTTEYIRTLHWAVVKAVAGKLEHYFGAENEE